MSEEDFALLCFLVIIDHHGQGYIQSHPSYTREKSAFLTMGYNAFGRLDSQNQASVFAYLKHWGIQIPEAINDKIS